MTAAFASDSRVVAYADPPYPGKAHIYPENTEVDHKALIMSLGKYDGWALSTDSPNLRFVLGLCPNDVQIAAWVRPNAMPFNYGGTGSVRSWEPVIYRPARILRYDPTRVRDVLSLAAPTGAKHRGITGTKPRGFGQWIFSLIGAIPGDTFIDLFPGSGSISDEWTQWDKQMPLFSAALTRTNYSPSPRQMRAEMRTHPHLFEGHAA